MSTNCFRIVAGMEPFVDDFWVLRFSISFFNILLKDWGKIEIAWVKFGKNFHIFLVLL